MGEVLEQGRDAAPPARGIDRGTISRQGSQPRRKKCSPADGYQAPSLPYGDPVALIRLKGWGLGLRWFGFEAESGLGEESVDQGGPVLDPLEPVLHDGGQLVHGAAGAQVAQAALLH